MALWTDAEEVSRDAINKWGIPITIQNKSETYTAGSYDEASWSDSGTKEAGSALFMPISQRIGGDEYRLVEQGQLEISDRKAYIPSGLEINERADVVIDAGSWDVIGIKNLPNDTNVVYRKIFLRSKI